MDRLERRIEETKLLNADVNLVEEVLPIAHIWLDNEVNVDWAVKDMKEVKEVLATFAKRHIMLEEFKESNGCPIWYLKGLHAKIRLCPTWSTEEGAMCRLVKVGETTQTYPVYKLICEGEQERSI